MRLCVSPKRLTDIARTCKRASRLLLLKYTLGIKMYFTLIFQRLTAAFLLKSFWELATSNIGADHNNTAESQDDNSSRAASEL